MKKFRITVLILFAIGIVFMIMGLIVSNSNLKHDARSNTECRTDQRVFDYADKLTGNEEQSLEKKITKWEDKTGMDIVVMTIDNAQAQSMFGTYMDDTYYEEFEAIKTVAKSFSEQERFGWENWEYNPQSNRSTSDGYVPSDSIIIAANYEAGDVWMSTTGTRVRARISDSKASSLTEKGGKYLRGCREGVCNYDPGGGTVYEELQWWRPEDSPILYCDSGADLWSYILYNEYVKEGRRNDN